MTHKDLTAAELESLTRPSNSGETTPGDAAPGSPPSSASEVRAAVPRYDFARLQRLARNQIAKLERIQTTAGRNFGLVLSDLLRVPVEVKLAAIEQLPASEAAASLVQPTCVSVLRAAPGERPWMLETSLPLAFALVDRLLGGTAQRPAVLRRPLTEIEQRLVGRVVSLFLQELRRACRPMFELEVSCERIESGAEELEATMNDAILILLPFQIAFGAEQGSFNLYLPIDSIEQLLSLAGGDTPTDQDRADEDLGRFRSSGPPRDLSVHLADAKISVSDLANLSAGDIIMTPQELNDPAVVSVDGVPRFHARPGALNGHKAVQITDPIDEPPAE